MTESGDTFLQQPDWRGIYQVLRDEVRDGTYRDGDCLPTQAELASRFGAGRHALRRALTALRLDGLIVGGQGARARVTERRIHLPVSVRTRFSVSTNKLGLPASARLVSRRRRVPTPEIAKLLDMPRLVAIPVAVILRCVGDLPTSLTAHYFSPEILASLPDMPGRGPSITRMLAGLGIDDFVRRQTLVTARIPTENEAVSLGVRRSEPVLAVTGQNVLPDGKPLEVSMSVFRTDNLNLLFVFEDG